MLAIIPRRQKSFFGLSGAADLNTTLFWMLKVSVFAPKSRQVIIYIPEWQMTPTFQYYLFQCLLVKLKMSSPGEVLVFVCKSWGRVNPAVI